MKITKEQYKKMQEVDFEAITEAMDQYLGYCVKCGDFTREMTEPDAEEYDCPVCGEDSVMGAEQMCIYL